MMSKTENLLTVARDFFMRYGIKSVSMDDLSSNLGISKKTLYQFVENKKDLVNKVMDTHITAQKHEIDMILDENLDAINEILKIARYTIELLKKMKPGVTYDLKKYYPTAWKKIEALHYSYMEEVILSNIKKGMKEGVYRKNIDPIVIARLYVTKALLLVDEKLFPINQFNLESLIREFLSYHMYGIASSKGFELINKIKKI